MKKILPPIFLGSILFGCAHVPPSNDLVSQIRAGIIATCGFQATIDGLIQVIGTFQPAANLAEVVINSICAAVTPLVAGHAGPRIRVSAPVVHGVAVRGRFVR